MTLLLQLFRPTLWTLECFSGSRLLSSVQLGNEDWSREACRDVSFVGASGPAASGAGFAVSDLDSRDDSSHAAL